MNNNPVQNIPIAYLEPLPNLQPPLPQQQVVQPIPNQGVVQVGQIPINVNHTHQMPANLEALRRERYANALIRRRLNL